MTTIKLRTYGARQKYLREERGLLQRELAEALYAHGVEVGKTYMSELERTDKVPGGEVVAAVAGVLETSADFMLGRTDDPAPIPQLRKPDYLTLEVDEAARQIENMDHEHRKLCLDFVGRIASLAKEKKATAQYKAVAGELLENISRRNGEDSLKQALATLEARLPGSSVVALRALREQTLMDGVQY